MQAQIWAFGLDRPQRGGDLAGMSVPLAYAPDTDPHSEREPITVLPEVSNVLLWQRALHHRHEREARIERLADRVVAGDRHLLMLGNGQTCFSQDRGLTHVV